MENFPLAFVQKSSDNQWLGVWIDHGGVVGREGLVWEVWVQKRVLALGVLGQVAEVAQSGLWEGRLSSECLHLQLVVHHPCHFRCLQLSDLYQSLKNHHSEICTKMPCSTSSMCCTDQQLHELAHLTILQGTVVRSETWSIRRWSLIRDRRLYDSIWDCLEDPGWATDKEKSFKMSSGTGMSYARRMARLSA